MHKISYKSAFTLAEVLITLAIIGIVAAMTIPTLLQKHRVQETISRLLKAQSIFANAVKMAEIDNGPIASWDIDPRETKESAEKLGKILIPYFKTQKICGTESGCFASNYKNLNGASYAWQPSTNFSYYRLTLEDGMNVLFVSLGSGCTFLYGNLYKGCGSIHVDINGTKGPNKAGIDLFNFVITENGIRPAGEKGYITTDSGCSHTGNSGANGLNCTAWVLYKKNMDYTFRDISWDE